MSQVRSVDKYPHERVFILSVILALLGLGCIVVAIVGFTLRVWGHYVGTGLWCGTVIFAAGISGVISSQFKGAKSVKCYFACSCVAIVMCLIMIIMSSAGLDYKSNFYKHAAYFKVNNQRSTFYVHVAALTFSLLSLMGNITSLFLCARHSSFYKQTGKKSAWRSNQGNYLRASTNSRSVLHEREMSVISSATRGQDQSDLVSKSGTVDRTKRKDSVNSRQSDTNPRNKKLDKKHSRRHSQSRVQETKQGCDSSVHQGLLVGQGHSKNKQQGYRSLPHRSNHRKSHTHKRSNVGKELLPTDFNEDELPSYADAISQQPLKDAQGSRQKDSRSKHQSADSEITRHGPNAQISSDGSSVKRRESQRSRGGVHSAEEQFYLTNEFRQNLQNEQVEKHHSDVPDTAQPSRLSFTKYITAHTRDLPRSNSYERRSFDAESAQPQNMAASLHDATPNLEIGTLKKQYKIDKSKHRRSSGHDLNINIGDVDHETDLHRLPSLNMSDKRPAFDSTLTDNMTINPSSPITIGSPRSAFRPVKRGSSHRSSSESANGQYEQRSDDDMQHSNRNSDSNANSMWKQMVLPSAVQENIEAPNDMSLTDQACGTTDQEAFNPETLVSRNYSPHQRGDDLNLLSSNLEGDNRYCNIRELSYSPRHVSTLPHMSSPQFNTLPSAGRSHNSASQVPANSSVFVHAVPVNRPQAVVVAIPHVPEESRANGVQNYVEHPDGNDLPFYSQIL